MSNKVKGTSGLEFLGYGFGIGIFQQMMLFTAQGDLTVIGVISLTCIPLYIWNVVARASAFKNKRTLLSVYGTGFLLVFPGSIISPTFAALGLLLCSIMGLYLLFANGNK